MSKHPKLFLWHNLCKKRMALCIESPQMCDLETFCLAVGEVRIHKAVLFCFSITQTLLLTVLIQQKLHNFV